MTEEKTAIDEMKDLILGDEFEKALVTAADIKNNGISLCKERNKNNYSHFYEIMLGSRVDVQEAMSHKGKGKTDKDKEMIKEFKKNTSQMYNQVCDLITPEEDLEEGELTKIQKIVQKVSKVVKMMKYIGNTSLEDEFAKEGITLGFKTMEDENDMFTQSHIKKEITDIFENGKTIKVDINRNNEEIKTNIYENSVPIDLQYDKNNNPTGIKPTDFCKLVELKAKMLKAQDDEAKEKVKDTAEDIAGKNIFQNARNDILNKKLCEITE